MKKLCVVILLALLLSACGSAANSSSHSAAADEHQSETLSAAELQYSSTETPGELHISTEKSALVDCYKHLFSEYDGIPFVHVSVYLLNQTGHPIPLQEYGFSIYAPDGEKLEDFGGELYPITHTELPETLEDNTFFEGRLDFFYRGAGTYRIMVEGPLLENSAFVDLEVQELKDIQLVPRPTEVIFGEPFLFCGLEHTALDNYELTGVANQDILAIHGDQPVLKIPVEVRNNSDEAIKIDSWARYTPYGPEREPLTDIGVWFPADYLATRRLYQPVTAKTVYLFCYYQGDGIYTYDFYGHTGERYQLTLPIEIGEN